MTSTAKRAAEIQEEDMEDSEEEDEEEVDVKDKDYLPTGTWHLSKVPLPSSAPLDYSFLSDLSLSISICAPMTLSIDI